jgi:HlyD family secretion protein
VKRGDRKAGLGLGHGLGLGMLLLGLACHRAADVPVYTVVPSHFARRVTAEGNLKAKNAITVSAPQQADFGPLKVAWIAADGSLLKKGDLVARFDPTDFVLLLRTGNEDLATAGNKRQKTDVDAKTTRVNLQRDARQADAELASARMFRFDDAEVFSRYQRIESQVDEQLASEKKTHANNVLGVRRTLSAADMALIDIEKKKADLKVRNANQGLSSLEVRAPYDGILVLQRDWRGDVPRVGSTLWRGSPIGEVPDLREMKAEIFVLEADAAGIAVGQKAMVTLESQPGVAYSGKISQIDKLARPRFRGVPVQYFGVTVLLDKSDPRVMKPGARVKAVLQVEDIANAFSIPRQALFEKNGKKIVYRKHDGKFEPVEVTIATSSAGRVVVTKGVRKGDELALVNVNKDDSR